jgi:hypothetical protein
MKNKIEDFRETYAVHERFPRKKEFRFRILRSDVGGKGWFVLKITEEETKLLRYDTRNSPFHNISACPAHTLIKVTPGTLWKEKGESNHFILKSNTRIIKAELVSVPAGQFNCLVVRTIFEIPAGYNGPPYCLRRLYIAKKVGIVKVETVYRHEEITKRDLAILTRYHAAGEGFFPAKSGNFWTYQWYCEFGPNKFNIHNTGQEDKYKPPKPK